jgi:hypothetical protein
MDFAPSRRAWLLASLTPLFALAIFRPWVREAFPVWDYPQVLPILQANPGVWDGAMAIAEWNRPDGRANYLSYLQFSFTWGLVGGESVGWQIARALVMLAVGVLIIQVARRLGATPIASAVAACVFLVAVPSTEGWLLLAGEQLATLLLLLAVLAAAGYTTTPAWRVRGLLIALLCAGVMLAKEVLGLLLPMVVLLALCWDPARGFRRPAFGPRERWLVALLLLVLVLEAWSVRSAMQDAVAGNYASAFGRDGFDRSRALTLFQAMLLPARFSSASAATTLYPANFAFLLLLLLGLIWPAGKEPRTRGGGWWALGLLWYPVVGALAYTLWPRYTAYYGIPFFAGSAGLLALAASRIERRNPLGGGLLVAGLGTVVVFFAAIASARTVRQKHATAALAAAVSRAWLAAPRLDTLLVVTPPQGGRRWPLSARELRNYAVFLGATDSALPLMLDASCDEVIRRLQRPLNRSGVLNDQNPCGRIPQQTVTWEKAVGYLDWASLRRVADTLRVDLLAPSWPPSARRTDPL